MSPLGPVRRLLPAGRQQGSAQRPAALLVHRRAFGYPEPNVGQQSCAVPWSSALLLLRPHLWVTQGQSRAAPLLPMGPTGTSSNRPAEAQSRSWWRRHSAVLLCSPWGSFHQCSCCNCRAALLLRRCFAKTSSSKLQWTQIPVIFTQTARCRFPAVMTRLQRARNPALQADLQRPAAQPGLQSHRCHTAQRHRSTRQP